MQSIVTRASRKAYEGRSSLSPNLAILLLLWFLIMLYGNHITLQPLSESDLDLMDWMNQDTETMRFLGALVRLEAELRDLFKNSKLISSNRGWGWMTIETPQQQKIGFVFLQPSSRLSEIELGYRIHRSYWGQGYATESARVLLSHAVNELSFNPIVAAVDPIRPTQYCIGARTAKNRDAVLERSQVGNNAERFCTLLQVI